MNDTHESNRVRWTTLVLVVLIVLLFLWYVVADRLTPYTAAARVQLYVVSVVPDVSGYVAEVPVQKNHADRRLCRGAGERGSGRLIRVYGFLPRKKCGQCSPESTKGSIVFQVVIWLSTASAPRICSKAARLGPVSRAISARVSYRSRVQVFARWYYALSIVFLIELNRME